MFTIPHHPDGGRHERHVAGLMPAGEVNRGAHPAMRLDCPQCGPIAAASLAERWKPATLLRALNRPTSRGN